MLPSRKAGVVGTALNFSDCEAKAFVDVCYHAMFGRAPDASGQKHYRDLILKAPNRETLIAVVRSMAMSQEARDFREHHLSMHGPR
ncbi:DUF4214 domain-containing protein [Sphingomonas sp. TZW2008]|uniref:DUF4214 domain-containing protein n=1 Tax=Sphingomonas sp. TZW2008 TaxID=1917973 RepID=UPI001181935B|nr:DUF4214 domain-containing protein [Sphingomonas sp. TZW2008]